MNYFRKAEMNVKDLLKKTSRGSLKYDRGPPTQEFLNECASIPKLSSFCSDTRIVILNEETDKSSENSKDDQQEKESKNITSPIPRKNHNKLVVSPEFGRSLQAIKNYEQQLENEAKSKKLEKEREFKQHTEQLQKEATRKMKEIEQENDRQAKYIEAKVNKQYQEGVVEMQEKANKLKEDHRQHAEKLENQRARLQEELRQKEKERKDRMDKIQSLLKDLISVLQKLSAMYQECEHKNRLPERTKQAIDLVHRRVSQGQQLMTNTFETGEITDDVVNKLMEHLKICCNAYDSVKEQIAEVNREAAAEAEAKAKAEADAKAKAEAEARVKAEAEAERVRQSGPLATSTPMPSAPTAGLSGTTGSTVTQASLSLGDDEVQCVDIEAFNNYNKLQQEIKDVENIYKTLATNAQLKKLKFSFQKAVNTPVNAISPISGEHLRDKLQRLLALLSGQHVDISNKRTSVNDHPEALPFCKHLVARMIVRKGEEQVSSKHETAFAIAAVAVGLWCDHPDVGRFLIGEFQKLCPYIVPYHVPRQEGQSLEEYHKSLGYKYDSDGKVEDQDRFLKRMSGVMRLYAALMVAVPPKGQNYPHPHSIENAWIWLSRVMNIEPLPDITTTMVYDMLQVTGHALYREYRKQFTKLLHILVKEFLPKLNRVASKAGGGPVSRLRTFLEESIKRNGQIAQPEGLLPNNFWFS